jgi:hypothetical protein
LALFFAAVGAVVQSVAFAPAYAANDEPWAICGSASIADLGVLERSLAPANGTVVQAGAPVTFSGNSRAAVSFQVASTSALLATPDIDSGVGTLQAGEPPAYAFTSMKASSTRETVYWQASFSDADIPECAGQPPHTYTTPSRTLTIVPAPPAQSPSASVTPVTSAAPPPLQASIVSPKWLRVTHGSLTYSIRCSRSCDGRTSYEVLVVRPHAKTRRLKQLDVNTIAVSVSTSEGDEMRVSHRYVGRGLRQLQGILSHGGRLELQITASLTGAAGGTVRVRRTIFLHR